MTTPRDLFKRGRRHEDIEPGEWPERSGKARVLIENRDPAELWARSEALREAGYDVATCTGPSEGEGEHKHCPLLEGRGCALVDGADVVMSTCAIAESRGILAALTSQGTPRVVFEAPEPEFDRYRDVAEGAKLIAMPLTEQGLLDAVAEVAASLEPTP